MIVTTDDSNLTGFVSTAHLSLTGGTLREVETLSLPTATYTPLPQITDAPTQVIPSPTPSPSVPLGRVLPNVAEIHAFPDRAAPVIGLLRRGMVVAMVGVTDDGQWLEINGAEPDGSLPLAGFVRAEQLSLVAGTIQGLPVASLPSLTPTPPPMTPTRISQAGRPSTSAIVVRRGPAEIFSAVGILAEDAALDVNAVSPDGLWLQIGFPNSPTGLGWVSLETVHYAGALADLPVVQGPPLPEATPVIVAVEGGVPNAQAPQHLTPVNPGVSPAIRSLPPNSQIAYFDLTELTSYVYEYGLVINGETPRTRFEDVFLRMTLAEDRQTGDIQIKIDGRGDLDSETEGDLSDLLPVYAGNYRNQGYIFTQTLNTCRPDDSGVVSLLSEDFPVLNDGTNQRLIQIIETTGVFALIDEAGLLGVDGRHYQFLGFRDGSSDGYRPSTSVKLDLWYTPDETVLFAYTMRFELGPGSDVVPEIVSLIMGPNFNRINFTGTINYYFLPLVVNADVSDFITPPDACDFLVD
jgi:hypothetical protein